MSHLSLSSVRGGAALPAPDPRILLTGTAGPVLTFGHKGWIILSLYRENFELYEIVVLYISSYFIYSYFVLIVVIYVEYCRKHNCSPYFEYFF